MQKLINSLRIRLLKWFLRREVEDLAMVYSLLIIKDLKTFKMVPNTLKEQVRECLIALEAEHLIIED